MSPGLVNSLAFSAPMNFKPPANPEDWSFPAPAELRSADPDLLRTNPDRIPGPENAKKKRKKSDRDWAGRGAALRYAMISEPIEWFALLLACDRFGQLSVGFCSM